MSTKDVVAPEGIEIDKVSFDENGEVVGLDDAVMDEVAGGLRYSDSDEGDKNKGCNNNGWC